MAKNDTRRSSNNARKSTKKKKKNTKNSGIKKVLKTVLIATLSLFIILFLLGGLLFTYYAISAPKLDMNKIQSQPSSTIYDKNNQILVDLGKEKREMITTKEIPLTLVNAITSIEDHRFFNHRGVDPIRITSSMLYNAKNDSTQGGSTLTQQLIKLSYFSTEKKDQTLKRKAQEAWLSIQLEQKESKEQIITLYANKVYMANGYYGMRTAAKQYYGKDLKDLTLAQTALLAGMPQSPNGYNPYEHPEAAKARRDTVLRSMLRYDKITQEECEQAINTPVNDGLQTLKPSNIVPAYLDNFVKQVIEEIRDQTGQDVTTAGLKVYTTMDSDAQKYLYDIVNTDNYVNYTDDDLQVATTIVDVKTGAVIAQIGARNQPKDTTFGNNQAVNTDRDWGSTMKPITDYAPAYEYGNYTSTGQILQDRPYNYPGTNTPVNNWDNQYQGSITARRALVQSRNVPAVETLATVGLGNSLDFLDGLGIKYPSMEYANAISSNTVEAGNEWGASSEKMAAAYAAFANGGTYIKPYYVNKIVNNDGQEKEFKVEKKRAMSETTAYAITDILKDVITQGTITNAYIPGLIQAGKTGTSNYDDNQFEIVSQNYGHNFRTGETVTPDENFVGYTPHYSMAVWTGYKNKLTPIYGPSLYTATDVYREMMSYLSANVPNEDWTMPDGVTRNGSEVTISSY